MISDIRFGHGHGEFIHSSTAFYVYHNLSETVLINTRYDNWLGIVVDLVAILSHETLHKVIYKLEGGRASSALDKWCKKRQWLYNDDTGICFLAKELEDDG